MCNGKEAVEFRIQITTDDFLVSFWHRPLSLQICWGDCPSLRTQCSVGESSCSWLACSPCLRNQVRVACRYQPLQTASRHHGIAFTLPHVLIPLCLSQVWICRASSTWTTSQSSTKMNKRALLGRRWGPLMCWDTCLLFVFRRTTVPSCLPVCSQHTEEREDGLAVEEGEMGDEDAPAPW